jgi:hypothetical protein
MLQNYMVRNLQVYNKDMMTTAISEARAEPSARYKGTPLSHKRIRVCARVRLAATSPRAVDETQWYS